MLTPSQYEQLRKPTREIARITGLEIDWPASQAIGALIGALCEAKRHKISVEFYARTVRGALTEVTLRHGFGGALIKSIAFRPDGTEIPLT